MMERAIARLADVGRELPDVSSQTVQRRISDAHEQAQPILFFLFSSVTTLRI